MRKTYCTKSERYKVFKMTKISYIYDKTLFLSRIFNKCGSEDENLFKEEESIEILKILGLINNTKERKKISPEF